LLKHVGKIDETLEASYSPVQYSPHALPMNIIIIGTIKVRGIIME